MVDLLLWFEAILIGILVVWWLEEFGIVNLGLYVYLGLKKDTRKSSKDPKTNSGSTDPEEREKDDFTGPVPLFTAYGYPLEMDGAKDGFTTTGVVLDTISWNGNKQFSGIHSHFKFLHELQAPRTIRWLKYQKNCVHTYLGGFEELRHVIGNKLNEVSDYEQIMQPQKKGVFYFHYRRKNVGNINSRSNVTKSSSAGNIRDGGNDGHMDADQERTRRQSQLSPTSPTSLTSASSGPTCALIKSNSLEDRGTVVLDLINDPLFDTSLESNDFVPSFVDAWVSEDGGFVVFGVSYRDSKGPLMKLYVKNTDTGVMLSDCLEACDVVGNVVWNMMSSGFFYSSRGSSDYATSCVRYHTVGTSQEADALVFSKPIQGTPAGIYNLLRLSSTGVSLFVHIFKRDELSEIMTCYSETNGNALYVVDVAKFVASGESSSSSSSSSAPSAPGAAATGITEITGSFDLRYEYITSNTSNSNANQFVWLRTNMDAPLFRIVKINLAQAAFEMVDIYRKVTNLSMLCKDCIFEDSEGAFLESAQVADRNILVVKYMLHASDSVMLFRIPYGETSTASGDNRFEAVPVAELPHAEYGHIAGPYCSANSSEILYRYTGFVDAGSVFCAKITRSGTPELSSSSSNSSSSMASPHVQRDLTHIGINLDPPIITELGAGLFSSHFETRQEIITGPSGNNFPIFIVGSSAMFEDRDSNAEMLETRPCLLCVYGGFGVPVMPQFSLPLLLFMKQCGGVVCVANISGGGEYGQTHHLQGAGKHRSSAVDDFIRVAEYLIENEYTTQQQLGIVSGGIGGLVVGASINKRPWLFSAAVINDGFFDAQNYPTFSPVIPMTAPSLIAPGQMKKVPPCSKLNNGSNSTSNAASGSLSLTSPTVLGYGQTTQFAREMGPFGSKDEPGSTRDRRSSSVDNSGSSSSSGSGGNEMGVSPVHTVANRDIPYPAMLLVTSNPKNIGACFVVIVVALWP
jgi:hypothetical protein